MSFTVRPATIDDVDQLVYQREEMFRAMETTCDYAAMGRACARWYREALPAGTFRAWLAEEDDAIVGGGGLIVMPWSPGPSRLDPRMAWVFNVFVEPAYRGRGVARALMEALHAWCRDNGIQRLALNATADGRRVYTALGYGEVPEPMMRLDL